MKIVQFSNGKYGIRKGLFFKKYLDFYPMECNIWRKKTDRSFKDCMTNKENIKEYLKNKEKETVISKETLFN